MQFKNQLNIRGSIEVSVSEVKEKLIKSDLNRVEYYLKVLTVMS